MSLIEVKGLKVHFFTDDGVIKALDGVSFSIEPEQTMALVGESGCGKSVTGRSIMGLIRTPPGRIVAGEILYRGSNGVIDLAKLSPRSPRARSIRGNEIAMIFQEPMTSLNPVFTIGDQIMEAIALHQKLNRGGLKKRAVEALKAVKISAPEQRINEYPHQLSGGMRQRIMIAMAMSCNPSLLIADEPTTALDVTIQAQVLHLMNNLKKDYRTAILFITHNLGVVAKMADHVLVMYLGQIMESAPVKEIFHHPAHPYTQGLMNSIPSLSTRRNRRLTPIAGVVPDLLDMPLGCPFEPRCPHAMDVCKRQKPDLLETVPNHTVACFLHM